MPFQYHTYMHAHDAVALLHITRNNATILDVVCSKLRHLEISTNTNMTKHNIFQPTR